MRFPIRQAVLFVVASFGVATASGLAAASASASALRPAANTQAPALAAGVPDLGGVRDLGPAPASLPVSLAVTLAYQRDAELEQLTALQSDPSSRYYHQFLSNAQFAAYFAPSAATELGVVAALQRAGFTIVNRYANRTVIDVVAPAAVAQKYFQTEIHRVQQPNAGLRYANVRPAILPNELRGAVSSITGFTNVIYVQSMMEQATAQQKATAKARALAVFGANATSLAGTTVAGFHAPAASVAVAPATTSNELRDPGFESGAFGAWQACARYSTTDPAFSKTQAHSGKYSGFAGSTSATSGEIKLDAGVCQSVTIPTNGVVSFWVYQYSNEPNTTNAFQEADLLDETGKRIDNLYATVDSTHGWKQLTFNLKKYAGGRYFLYFGVQGNGNKTHETYQYVDDVSLTGSAYPTTGTKIGGALLGPDFGYGPAVVADAYDLPVQHGFDGAGRATGIEISGDYLDTDLYAYLGYFGITRGGTTTRIAVDGGAKFSPVLPSGSSEATLDVETIVALAPSTELYMYEFPELSDKDIEDGYNRAVSDNLVDVVNSSFGGCETGDTAFDSAVEKVVAQAAAKGITFSASSGDQGSAACDGKTGVNAPASTPDVVAVGGTSLYVNDNGSYNSEAGWDGSTGGVSKVWAKPPYQSGIKGIIGNVRNVPDIAFAADPNTGTSYFFAGAWQGPTGGTSWASPIFSALQTEIDQRHNARFGYVNPSIYAAYSKYGAKAFHDIKAGSNGAYSAHAGYDNVTGLGSVFGYAFSGDE